jgi:hypothetical protein
MNTLAKQFAIGVSIAVLMPLSVYYGIHYYRPPPDREEHYKSQREAEKRLDDQVGELEDREKRLSASEREQQRTRLADERQKNRKERSRLADEQQRIEKELEAEERDYQRRLFWVSYLIGSVAFVVGTFVGVQSVGAGLMFGGLFTVASGCYSYWDKMEDSTRFVSLLVALVGAFVLGCWRFRSSKVGDFVTKASP